MTAAAAVGSAASILLTVCWFPPRPLRLAGIADAIAAEVLA
jgi:hypothetical protein